MKILGIAALTAAALAFGPAAFADHDEDHGHGHGRGHHKHHDDDDQGGDRDEDHRRFNDDERRAFSEYYGGHPRGRGRDEDDDDEQLPPGLAKQHKIPPGWQKKIHRGQRIPDDVWEHRVPVPHDVVIKLPMPPPPGVVLVRIHDHVLRVVEKTHEVLDDLGLPHPPTPH